MDQLVQVMTPVLWQVVRAYGHDRQAAEDIVQATWLGFVRLHATIEDPQAVASWLITSARRGAAQHSRAGRRGAEPVEEEQLARRLPDEVAAEDRVVLDDEAARLWGAVETLDDRCRRLVRVVAFLDRPDYAALSRDLEMPVGSIGPTRARCLDKLRLALTAPTGGSDR